MHLHVKDLKGQLELADVGTMYADIREETMSSIEGRRDSLGGSSPMEVDNIQAEHPNADGSY